MSRIKLLPHERDLLSKGLLANETHKGATSVWLSAKSSGSQPSIKLLYRPMGDKEVTLHGVINVQGIVLAGTQSTSKHAAVRDLERSATKEQLPGSDPRARGAQICREV
jgi:hypothetical protein